MNIPNDYWWLGLPCGLLSVFTCISLLTLPEACNASGSVPQDCRSALFNLRSTIPLCFNRCRMQIAIDCGDRVIAI
ncbi:hypothetical protein QL093DRAFT_2152519 [Fusarium oxysporum]|nr:hypothetical protein QL093DRAFT_2152519 [Fusarium oxysporum]